MKSTKTDLLNGEDDVCLGAIRKIFERASEEPDKAKAYLRLHSTPTGCLCGDVVAFNTSLAFKHSDIKIPSATVRQYVKRFELGCTGKNMKFNGKSMTCLHLSWHKLPAHLIDILDNKASEEGRILMEPDGDELLEENQGATDSPTELHSSTTGDKDNVPTPVNVEKELPKATDSPTELHSSTTGDKDNVPTPVNVEKELPKESQSFSSTNQISAAEASTSAGNGATGLLIDDDVKDSEENQLSLEDENMQQVIKMKPQDFLMKSIKGLSVERDQEKNPKKYNRTLATISPISTHST
ncbi:hypothetical protein ACROYT_G008608 [Oculina patagonica]